MNLEEEIKSIESIKDWTEKTNKINELKEFIKEQQKYYEDLMNSVISDEEIVIKKKKKTNTDLGELKECFDNADNINDMIYYYVLINNKIKDITPFH